VINTQNISEASFGYIKAYFDRFLPMTPDEIKDLMSYCDLRQFDKNTVILQEGETDDYLNMIVTGIVIKYAKVGNKKMILQLSTEGHVINSEISFLTRTPSKVYLETLEPTVMVSLQYDKMEEALAWFPKGERLGRLIQEGMYVKKDERRYAMLSKSMRERFLEYVNQHPHMLQRVPQKYLASYLNITSETFSRFKHLLRESHVK
jgi:CRP-like cAMP-binding protein